MIISFEVDEDHCNPRSRYVLENPVRKGLTQDLREYPFKGSTLYDFKPQW